MIILARPSVSPYMARTLFEIKTPAVLADPDVGVPMRPALDILTAADFKKDPKRAYRSLILTSSENALSALYRMIPHDDRVLKARLFKDKAVFRGAIKELYPNFFFAEHDASEIARVDVSKIPFPAVLKPATGISSIGVYRAASATEWKTAVEFLRKDLAKYAANYDDEVVEGRKVLIEEWIQGEELAIDGYYNSSAEPVILNILQHMFASDGDTSDLIYCTRRALIRKYYKPLMRFLARFGDIFDLKRFPFHLEVRVNKKGEFIPIELNPLRFSGLGTAEIAEYAYAINVYKAFFGEQKPDWDTILKGRDESVYTFMCADLPTDRFRKKGLRVDDRAFFKQFDEVLDYRILDEQETSTFAVIFFRSADLEENRRLLRMDVRKYLSS